MATQPPTTEVTDANGFVVRNLECPFCQHNLRGVGGDRRCPECGAAVAHAIERVRTARRWLPAHIALAILIVLGVVGSGALNCLMLGPGLADLMPHEATRVFRRVWVFVALGALGAVPFLLVGKQRAPVTLWLLIGFALISSLVGVALNYVLEVLIIMSV